MGDKITRDSLTSINLPSGITELRRLEQILARLSDAARLNSTLEDIARAMAKALDTDMNAIYLVDRLSGELVCGASIGLPDEYVKAVARVPIGPEAGVCGRAVYIKSVVVVEDMRIDPNWTAYLAFSESAGLRAVWSVPIINASGEVLGTFATYYREPHGPEKQQIEWAQVYARHAAIALENARLYEQAEEGLRQQKEILQEIFDHIPLMICFFDKGGQIKLINREWERTLGWSMEEIERQDLNIYAELYPDPQVRQRVREFITTAKGEWADFKTRVKDGRVIDTTWANVHLSDGTSFGIGQGTTERRYTESEFVNLLAREQAARFEAEHVNKLRAELLEREASARAEAEAARRAAERERTSLKAIIEQMAEGMIVCDQTGTVIRTNQQAIRLYGYDAEDILSNGAEPFVEGRFSDEAGRVVVYGDLPVPSALREQRTVEKRLWFNRPDGQRLLLSLSASPFFNEDDQIAGAILLTRDVTEQQREHEQAQQADKLRALGQLASGVAHNFNNALAAVIGYTQLALPKVKDPDIEKYLSVVEQSAKDAARMVERIQNFARSRSRKDEFIPVRLTDIIRDAIDITRPRWQNDAQALGLKYEVKLTLLPDKDPLVSGEPSELREVFVNIIFNALDAMPLGGSLSVTVALNDDNLGVSFVDTGGGMTDEIKRRIFEPFFTTKGAAGLGMGLSESYQIIERHNGRIDVESQLRRGTTITIKLPLMKAAEGVIEQEIACLPVTRARILVIDDEEPVSNVISIMLRELGHTVYSAYSAEEGLRLFNQYQFDIVFTDLAMPKVDGIAVATEIKARNPKTKIVLMSGYGADKIYERAAGNNCIDAAISKPFRMTKIQEVLRALLE